MTEFVRQDGLAQRRKRLNEKMTGDVFSRNAFGLALPLSAASCSSGRSWSESSEKLLVFYSQRSNATPNCH